MSGACQLSASYLQIDIAAFSLFSDIELVAAFFIKMELIVTNLYNPVSSIFLFHAMQVFILFM